MGKIKDIFIWKKNNFIRFIILAIISISGLGIYLSYSQVEGPKISFVLLVEGNGILNGEQLKNNDKQALDIGDIIKTYGETTLAIIEWWDGSVTRMGGNSTIVIENLFVSSDKNNIQIAFDLQRGKTWSNVISFLGENSFFKQKFQDETASVRGTVFSVNLDEAYLFVSSHAVNVIDSEGKNYVIEENSALSLNDFSLISFVEYIKNFKESAWDELNKKLDTEFLETLKRELTKNLNTVSKATDIRWKITELSETQKAAEYKRLVSEYQKIKFIDGSEWILFEQKLKIQENLILLATPSDKKALVQNSFYDFKDALKQKSNLGLEKLIPIINGNTSLLGELQLIDISKSLESSSFFEKISQEQLFDMNNIKSRGADILNSSNTIREGLEKKFLEQTENLFNK